MKSQASTGSSLADVLILGAGISGLSARRIFSELGLSATVLEKSRGLGGRLATRRWEGCAVDLGAQYASARDHRWIELLRAGLDPELREIRLESDSRYTRYIHAQGMSRVARIVERLEGVEPSAYPIELSTRGVAIESAKGAFRWGIRTEQGRVWYARALLLTAPLPQSLELLKSSGMGLEAPEWPELQALSFEPCIAWVTRLEQVEELPASGVWKNPFPGIAGIFEQSRKGLACLSGWSVIHLSPDESRKLWDLPQPEIEARIRALLPGHWSFNPGNSGSSEKASFIHKWRYCEPSRALDRPFGRLSLGDREIFIAGDAFQKASIEGAFHSGREAAWAIADSLYRKRKLNS